MDPRRHAEDLFQANSLDQSGKRWTYLPYGPFPTLDSYRQWVDRAASLDDPLFFAVAPHATGQASGVLSLMRIDSANGCIEVGGIHFSPVLQQTAAATEAIFLLMTLVFDDLGYRRLEWKCDALNEPSRRAAARFGFTYEGTFRQAVVVKGRNRDTAWYSIIDAEWPRLKAAYQRWLSPANFDAEGRQRTALSDLTRPDAVP